MFNKRQMIYQSKNCINIKKPYPKECRLCIQHCPHAAISDSKDIAEDKCTECGVCMAVCPSDGILDKDMDKLGDYLLNSDMITLNCPLAEPRGYEISCLGMLDKDAWTTLFIHAASKEVRILTGDCGKCPDRKACAISVAAFKEVHEAWPQHPRVGIEIDPYNESGKTDEGQKDMPAIDNPNNMINKRKLNLKEQGKNKIKELFPDIMAEESYTTPRSRKWLSSVLENNKEMKIPYKSVKIDERCTGCGVCSKICPQGALQQIEKDGKYLLIYKPLKCVKCSRCVDICGSDAMRLEYVQLTQRHISGKIMLCETVPRYCEKCAKQIFHHKDPGLCMACAAKDPGLKGVLY